MLGMDPRVWNALLLTSLGAAGTGLGGLIVVIQPKFNFKRLGYLQGCAAGLMMSLSFFDLFPESVEAIGEAAASFWFFVGVAFFAFIVAFIPEPDSSNLALDVDVTDLQADAKKDKSVTNSTSTSTAAKTTAANFSSSTMRRRSGGGLETDRPVVATHGTQEEAQLQLAATREAKKKVLLSGLITALGIALHNFPEGVAVFLASIKSTSIGLSLAIAIALHNIPEGVAVALPVYFATGSRWKGFAYAFVSGLAEPAAVIILGVVFRAFWVNKVVIDCLLAAVGGIMAFLSLQELLPLAIEHAGRQAAVMCLFLGMAIMSANLLLLSRWLGDAH